MVGVLWFFFGFVLALFSAWLLLGRRSTWLCFVVVCCSGGRLFAQTSPQDFVTRASCTIYYQWGSGLSQGNDSGIGPGVIGSYPNGDGWVPASYTLNGSPGSGEFTFNVDLNEFDGYWQGTFLLVHYVTTVTGVGPPTFGPDGATSQEVVIVYDSANDRHVELQGSTNAVIHGVNGDNTSSYQFWLAVPAFTAAYQSALANQSGPTPIYTFWSPALSGPNAWCCSAVQPLYGEVDVSIPEHADSVAATATTQPSTQPTTSQSTIFQDVVSNLLDANTGVLGGMQTRMGGSDAKTAVQGVGGFGQLWGSGTWVADTSWEQASDDFAAICIAIMPNSMSSSGGADWLNKVFDSGSGFVQQIFYAWYNVYTQYAGIFSFIQPWATLGYCLLVLQYTLRMASWGFRWLGIENVVPPGADPECMPVPGLVEG